MVKLSRRLDVKSTLSRLCGVMVIFTSFIWVFEHRQILNSQAVLVERAGRRAAHYDLHRLEQVDKVQPGRDYSSLSRHQITKRISSLSLLGGFHNKSGIIHPYKWLPDFRDEVDSAFMKWENDVGSHRDDIEQDHPKPFPECWVHVNHHYRYIWVKFPKSGGTALKKQLAFTCNEPDHPSAHGASPFCSQRAWYSTNMTVEDAKAWWRDYFVFAVVRNPYSRFASSFGFINKSMKKCEQSKFNEVCRDPFLQAKTCIRDGCCNMQHHHVHHMAEQSACLVSEEGGIAVDFVGQTETLDSDFEIIAKEINRRRKKGVEPIRLMDKVEDANVNANYTDGYTDIYADNPGCLESVEQLFGADLKNLGYDS